MCFGLLSAILEKDGESGRLVEIVQCKFCGKTYYWPEHQWSEPASDPTALDVPEPKKTESISTPLKVHVNVAA
jgi:hypothetical protein